jgi:hypothetical protein
LLAEVYEAELPFGDRATVPVFTFHAKLPPEGLTLVVHAPFVVALGAVEPVARCVGLQLIVIVGSTAIGPVVLPLQEPTVTETSPYVAPG